MTSSPDSAGIASRATEWSSCRRRTRPYVRVVAEALGVADVVATRLARRCGRCAPANRRPQLPSGGEGAPARAMAVGVWRAVDVEGGNLRPSHRSSSSSISRSRASSWSRRRVGDIDPRDHHADDTERHRQAVVVVGRQRGAVEPIARGITTSPSSVSSTAPPSRRARCQITEPVTFLARINRRPNSRRRVGEHGDGGDGRHEVRHVGHVDVDAAQARVGRTTDDGGIGAPLDGAPITPKRSAKRASPCSARSPRPRTSTRPERTAATASG